MHRTAASVIALSSVLLSSTSHSQTVPHQALAENIGALAVAKRWCEEYEVDIESGIRLALQKGVNPLKGIFANKIEETKETMEGHLGNLGVKKFCAITYERYRPGGPVPGFMVKK